MARASGFERSLCALVLPTQPLDVALVIVRRDQFVLAAGEKRNEIAQKFCWLSEPPEMD